MPTTGDAIRMRGYWRTIPDRRTASYYRRLTVGPPATYSSAVSVLNLWHRNFKNVTHPNNPGVYVVYEADLFFPKETNSAYATTSPPLPGDQIQDAAATTIPYTGRRWTITDVEEAGGQGTWKLHSVGPAILNGVGVAILIQSPTVTVTNSGLRQVTGWTTITGGSQTAWIQGTSSAADDLLGKRQIPDNGIVYLPTSVAVDAQMTVLEVATSRRFTITAENPAMNFVDLQSLNVELLH